MRAQFAHPAAQPLDLPHRQAQQLRRLRLSKTFRWRPQGPVMDYFRRAVVPDYYAGGFDGEGEMLMLVHGQVGRNVPQVDAEAALARYRAVNRAKSRADFSNKLKMVLEELTCSR